MGWLFEPFEYEFMRRALLACVLVGFTNGFLGAFVVVRRLALMADALSHSLLPGLALAALFVGLTPGGLLLGGLLAAILVVLGGHMISLVGHRGLLLGHQSGTVCPWRRADKWAGR